jgi:hypothetical protein
VPVTIAIGDLSEPSQSNMFAKPVCPAQHGCNILEEVMTNSEFAAAIEYSIRARFDEISQLLRDPQYASRCDKPIGYWALTGDRRLPYALLERTVGDITATSFRDLSQTPAIGKKKMASLVMLLERVVDDRQPAPAVVVPDESVVTDDRFTPDAVSESHWEAWRETVSRHHLSNEPLGRLAPSLRALPTVIWRMPLSTYVDMSLGQLRRLKTHGDKRVRSVLEIFFFIHQVLSKVNPPRHIVAQLRPSFVIAIEQWVLEALHRDQPLSIQELRQGLVLPLLNQIEADSDEEIGRLMAGRLGIESSAETVIEQAERLGVTRARVYQLLELATEIINVRWPEGAWQLAALNERFNSRSEPEECRNMLSTLRALLYPAKARVETAKVEVLEAAGTSA